MAKGSTIKESHIGSTLELVSVQAQMFSNLYKQFQVSHGYMLPQFLAGSSERIFLTQREIRNCTVEELTSFCAVPAGPQPPHTH